MARPQQDPDPLRGVRIVIRVGEADMNRLHKTTIGYG
jgi:hypothetical protein